MSAQLKTPGVYVEEISKLPPSVAEVETAIPAFVGYTEKATKKTDNDLKLVPTRITSMLEFEEYFGGANQLKLSLVDDEKEGTLVEQPTEIFLMYYAMQMFFANGGGPCYIVSVDDYSATAISKDDLKEGLDTLEREDEPTLLVFPDAISLEIESDFYGIYSDALAQANKMKDRFVILDTFTGEPSTIANFRSNVAGDKYGAAYYPHLNTILSFQYAEDVAISHEGTGYNYVDEKARLNVIKNVSDEKVQLETLRDDAAITNATHAAANETLAQTQIDAINAILDEPIEANLDVSSATKFKDSIAEFLTAVSESNEEEVEVLISMINSTLDTPISATLDVSDATKFEESIDTFLASLGSQVDEKGNFDGQTLTQLKESDPLLYASLEKQIKAMPVVLGPSAAIAGAYAKTDSTKGVWKAPANLGLSYVSSLTEKVTQEAQESLNVDDNAGKSINAIRQFRGKGILIWGARTLDGNSNEWRYVPVRRFFNMVEESVKKAMEGFVFESNNAKTWVKVQTMIENFLNQQWRLGALAGATPKDAYYVSVGLDKTMSAQDILEGRMNVEIGMAAVRPAEFIVLQFSHKLQES